MEEIPELIPEDEKFLQLQAGLKQKLISAEIEGEREKETLQRRKSKSRRRGPFYRMALIPGILLCLLLAVVITFLILRQLGREQLTGQIDQEAAMKAVEELKEVSVKEEGTISYQGKNYRYKEGMINLLLMGIDLEALSQSGTIAAGESGQADTLWLLSIDAKKGKSTLCSIPRDTLADVNVYSVEGNFVETRKLPICLAYAYGDGRESSCENTLAAVSRLMYGVPVTSYAAIDLKAIGILNDAVGGVTVEVLQDLRKEDPQLVAGEVLTLEGEQAETYVRYRDTGAETATFANTERMERQQQYLSAFAGAVFTKLQSDPGAALSLYRAVCDSMVTNITTAQVTCLAPIIAAQNNLEHTMRTIPGSVQMGEEYAEYQAKEKKLFEMVLEIFYEEIGK